MTRGKQDDSECIVLTKEERGEMIASLQRYFEREREEQMGNLAAEMLLRHILRALYNAISEILGKVDFGSIWSGFHRFGFALYNESEIYLEQGTIPYDTRFLGNTAIEYSGETIAIWNVVDPSAEDPILLASNIIHEMFHAYQKSQQETRFPNDLILLAYPESLENHQYRRRECKLLAEAYKSSNEAHKRERLAQYAQIRIHREKLIGNIIEQEFYCETIEGMAEFAGCMALKQLSEEKFHVQVSSYLDKLLLLDESFFDIRRMLYFSGAIFLLLLSDMNINFHHQMKDQELGLFPLIFDQISKDIIVQCEDDSAVEILYNEFLESRKEKFRIFLATHNNTVDLDSFICGYDPMNMIRLGNMILCNHFVMLKNESMTEPLFLRGPVLLNLKDDSYNLVSSYIH